jgi:hypothetical protein
LAAVNSAWIGVLGVLGGVVVTNAWTAIQTMITRKWAREDRAAEHDAKRAQDVSDAVIAAMDSVAQLRIDLNAHTSSNGSNITESYVQQFTAAMYRLRLYLPDLLVWSHIDNLISDLGFYLGKFDTVSSQDSDNFRGQLSNHLIDIADDLAIIQKRRSTERGDSSH